MRRARLIPHLILCAAVALSGSSALAATPEERLLELVNDIRVSRDHRPFVESHRLSRRAERNSQKMARNKELSHSKLSAGMAENIGTGSTLRRVVRAWMRSGPHKRNLLGNHRKAGVGVDKAAGLYWVTLILR